MLQPAGRRGMPVAAFRDDASTPSFPPSLRPPLLLLAAHTRLCKALPIASGPSPSARRRFRHRRRGGPSPSPSQPSCNRLNLGWLCTLCLDAARTSAPTAPVRPDSHVRHDQSSRSRMTVSEAPLLIVFPTPYPPPPAPVRGPVPPPLPHVLERCGDGATAREPRARRGREV